MIEVEEYMELEHPELDARTKQRRLKREVQLLERFQQPSRDPALSLRSGGNDKTVAVFGVSHRLPGQQGGQV